MTIRVAMWSGPRNISTAMMRAWENRYDTQVIDEPFYAYYLRASGKVHPMQDDVLASQPQQWQQVVEQLLAPRQCDIFYQKMMTHHMLDEIDLSFCAQLKHCFLIRNPANVVNSYVKKIREVNDEDIGIKRQWQLYQKISEISGQDIPVIDSKDVLKNPRAALSAVCEQLGLDFDETMLSWPQGRRDSDGVWAPHWYQRVEASTEFEPYRPETIKLTAAQQAVADENQDAYQQMFEKRLMP
ncbi:sulfotransferase-like domain-containing protein [Thalassotalea litorea]|uniref:sulfotransferase-like domain-containing protein n=1 Tax=Thalassotalea litorea TaxID=2020715 RepID=UPI003736D9D2